jgi:CheY-like chemotaxis protein
MQEHFDIFFICDNPHKAERAINSLDGFHVIKRIKHIAEGLPQSKSDEPRKVIPVVGLTSLNEEKGGNESYKFSVNSYLDNPVNFKSFGKAIITERGLYRMILDQKPIPNNKL